MNPSTRSRFLPIAWTAILFMLGSAVMSTSSILRHHVFESSFDFAIFAQAIRNTWSGYFLYSSIKGGICLLGDHVSPILAILAPLFALWDDPKVLLITQAVAATSSVFPLYYLARFVLDDDWSPVVFVISYLLYLPLRNAIRFDFHPELLGDPLILWAFYFIVRDKLALASFFLALTLTTKETACAPVAMLALWAFWFQRKKGFGLLWLFISIGVFFAAVKVIAPYFGAKPYFYLGGNYFSWTQNRVSEFIEHVFQLSSLTYLKKIFLPLGLLSFLNPSALILTVPILFQNLAAKNLLARSTFFQYTAFLTPFVFVSAIYGSKTLFRWCSKGGALAGRNIKIFTSCWLIGWSVLLSGKFEFQLIANYLNKNTSHWGYVRTYLKTIPRDRSVRTHEFFAPHLANRKELHIYENQHPLEGGSERARNAEYVIVDRAFLGEAYEKRLTEIETNGYHLAHAHDGFYLYIKKTHWKDRGNSG